MTDTDLTTAAGDGYATRVAADTIRIERVLPGPIDRVWRYLTEPELRRRWLAGGPMALVPGGDIELVFHNDALTPGDAPAPDAYARHGGESRLQGLITDCDTPRLLAFTWGRADTASHVRFDLQERQGRVTLKVTHSRVTDPGTMLSVSAGWHTHLDLLVALVEGREHAGFWRSFAAVEPVYRARTPARG